MLDQRRRLWANIDRTWLHIACLPRHTRAGILKIIDPDCRHVMAGMDISTNHAPEVLANHFANSDHGAANAIPGFIGVYHDASNQGLIPVQVTLYRRLRIGDQSEAYDIS